MTVTTVRDRGCTMLRMALLILFRHGCVANVVPMMTSLLLGKAKSAWEELCGYWRSSYTEEMCIANVICYYREERERERERENEQAILSDSEQKLWTA